MAPMAYFDQGTEYAAMWGMIGYLIGRAIKMIFDVYELPPNYSE